MIYEGGKAYHLFPQSASASAPNSMLNRVTVTRNANGREDGEGGGRVSRDYALKADEQFAGI